SRCDIVRYCRMARLAKRFGGAGCDERSRGSPYARFGPPEARYGDNALFLRFARDASTASGTGQPRRAVELAGGRGRFSARCERTRAAVRVHIKCATMDLRSASFLPRKKDNGMYQMRGAIRKPEQE